VEATTVVGVTIVVEATGIVEIITIVATTIMVEIRGMDLSGSVLAGVDGGRGWGLLITHTIILIPLIIPTTRRHPRSSNSSLRCISSGRSSTIGIIAKIPRGIILT